MLQIEINKTDLRKANYEMDNNMSSQVRRRMMVVYLKGMNYRHCEIAQITGFSANGVTGILKRYLANGLDCLFYSPKNSTHSELMNHLRDIRATFEKKPPHSVAEAQDRIFRLTGINRGPTQTRKFMKGIGMRFRKANQIPAKCDPEVQQEFLEKRLKPLLRKAKAQKCDLYFVDAAHFTWGLYLCQVWSFFRVFIPAPSGRYRFNVLGALNIMTQKLTVITNSTTVNADTVIELMKLVAAKAIWRPAYMVFDNARYMHNRRVKEMGRSLGIRIVYLPSYSPNLNLIERLWKYMKKKSLYGRYYDTFQKFKSAIENCIDSINYGKTEQEELETLLAPNFQAFTKSQFQAA